MKTLLRDFLTGITSIVGLLLLIWMLMQFGELTEVGQRFGNFSIRTGSASGISGVARVTLNGVQVGNVTELSNDPEGGVLIDIRIREGVHIPEDFRAHVETAFVGESTLDLRSASGESLPAIPAQGEVYDRTLITLGESIRRELAGPSERFDEIADAVLRLSGTYEKLGEETATLTDDVRRSLEEFDQTAQHTRGEISRAVDEFERTTSLFDQRLELLASETSEAVAAVERTLANTDQTLANADQALVSADETLSEVRAIARAVNSGRGTLGMLLKDDELYRNLVLITEEIDKTLLELRLAIEKFRDEGFPLRF